MTDNWIEFHGNKCPVPPDTQVEVEMFGAVVVGKAGDFNWTVPIPKGAKVHYRIINSAITEKRARNPSEGHTQTDVDVLRLANDAKMQEIDQLIDLLRKLTPAAIACGKCGGDDAACPNDCVARKARAHIWVYDYSASQEPK